MITALDTETQGLDATKYIVGCMIKETNENSEEIYMKKEKLWKEIIELGEKENKRGKTLNVYAHNHQYDFYAYANLKDKNIKIFCQYPFIASYKMPRKDGKGNREAIKFLDTYAIFKMPLADLGEKLGLPKIETPEYLKTGQQLTIKQINEAIPYLKRDTQIVLKAIRWIKNKLEEEGVQVKRLYTINQIAIAYIINKLTKLEKEKTEHLLWNTKTGEFRRTFRAKEIHSAYRGGRVEAFQTGEIEGVTEVDKTNAYGKSITEIKIPNLKTERKTWKPLQRNKTITEVIEKIGVTRAFVKNENCEIGFLPIRTPTGNYYPKKGQYLIGTWTNIELEYAIKNGYKIIDIEWTVSYEEGYNPFTEIYNRLYKNRTDTSDAMNRQFYKDIINRSIGKFAQTKTGQQLIIDDIEKAEEYIKNKYQMIKGLMYNIMYKKDEDTQTRKKYYCPIIPTLVNANARIKMYEKYKQIPKEDLIYTDTDSVIFKGNHLKVFEITDEMGAFKIEEDTTGEKLINVPCKIYGRKTYKIGNHIKVSGVSKKDLTVESFEKGYLKTSRMETISTTTEIEKIGTFKEEGRDLNKQLENHKKTTEMLEEQEILIDEDINDIGHFIQEITKTFK